MSLAKSDSRIARRYLGLGDRDDLAALVMEELDLTRSWVIRIAGGGQLLQNKPVLQRAVKLRSPYVDALSLLQLRALRALRDNAATGTPRRPGAAAPAAALGERRRGRPAEHRVTGCRGQRHPLNPPGGRRRAGRARGRSAR